MIVIQITKVLHNTCSLVKIKVGPFFRFYYNKPAMVIKYISTVIFFRGKS